MLLSAHSLTPCAASIAGHLITRGSDVFTAHHSPRTHQHHLPDSGAAERRPPIIRFSSFPLPHHLTLANGRGATQPICTTTADCAIFTPFPSPCHEDRKKREMSSHTLHYFPLLPAVREIAPTAQTGTIVHFFLTAWLVSVSVQFKAPSFSCQPARPHKRTSPGLVGKTAWRPLPHTNLEPNETGRSTIERRLRRVKQSVPHNILTT
jgi:hypothetical protein